MAFGFVSDTTGTNVSTGSATKAVPLPASIVAGNLLVLLLDIGSNTTTATTPTGWTQRTFRQDSGGGTTSNTVYAYSKIAAGSEGASVSVTLSAATWTDTYAAQYSGNDGTTEFDTAANNQDAAATTTHNAPSVTVATTGNLTTIWTGSVTTAQMGASPTAPAGWSVRRAPWDNANVWIDRLDTPSGATGSLTVTTTPSSQCQNVVISFAVASSATTAYKDAAGRLRLRPGISSRPTADVSIGNWTTNTGATTNLYATVDETTPDDTDYIQSGTTPTNDTAILTLQPLPDAGTTQGLRVRVHLGKSVAGAQMDLTATLQAGTTDVATGTFTDVAAGVAEVQFALTATEVATFRSNGGFANPRLKIVANQV